MKNKPQKGPLGFKHAVEATDDIKKCYQKGLQGLGAHSAKIELSDTTKCEGSVDLDSCITAKYPQSNRWDYFFSYKGEIYFVEVHSANTAEVSVVLKKLQWLKDWLQNQAPEINKLKAKNTPYYWIQSKGFNIPKTSTQFRIITQAGLKPIAKLSLN